MSYSRNFGFRSFENIVRDGRFRTPRTGDAYLIGTAVMVDPATPGYFTRPAAAQPATPLCGIVLYEHIQHQGTDMGLTSTHDSPYNTAPPGRYAQMIHGVGTKVWFRNTVDRSMYDGRIQEGVSLVALAPDGVTGVPTLAVGDFLTPAADGTFVEGSAANGWLIVEQLNPATGLVEARFRF